MAHVGSRENPALCDWVPGELDRACSRVWHPSPGQASAGNYKMAHAIVGGLPVTIETPRDRMRSGVAPDGTPWKVQMPAHYGYVKGTEGFDGDHVDVYVGPESHKVEKLPVWVIDQIDADELNFDEHKAMIGFPNSASARNAYFGAFSDGRGKDRVGAVVKMPFSEFCAWLKSGNTKTPLAYRNQKSASVVGKSNHYCPSTCSCRSPQEKYGGFMATNATATGTTPSPSALGWLTGAMSKALGRMTPEERTALMADASVAAGVELGKAADLMSHGDDGGHPGRVTDQWDGAPDDHLEVGGGHGPNSTAAPGKVNVGPSQAASGNGAETMERQYSRHAPQSGVQAATERLGRDIAGLRGAMKSMLRAFEATNMQFETIKSGIAAAPALPDIDALVTAAVAKAMEKVTTDVGASVAKALAKEVRTSVAAAVAAKAKEKDGEEEGEEEGDDDEAEEAFKACSESETTAEVDDEDGEDEAAKSKAASMRLMAKSRLKWADLRLAKAVEFAEDGKPASCTRQFTLAQINVAKANGYMEAAKAIIGGTTGPKTKALAKSITKLDKAIKAAPVDNQKVWPASADKGVGKSQATGAAGATATVVQPANGVSKSDLDAAMAAISKAVEGQGMLTAKVGELFAAMSGQSRNVTAGGQVLPPVFSLAKGGDDLMAKEAEIIRMAQEGQIRPDDADKARDVISNIRAKLPEPMITAKIARLAQPVQDVILRQAA